MLKTIAGIDLGSHKIKLVVVEQDEKNRVRIISYDSAKTSGAITQGTIKNAEYVYNALEKLIDKVRQKTKMPDEFFVSVDGASLKTEYVTAKIPVQNPEKEIGTAEIEYLEKKAKSELKNKNIRNWQILEFERISSKVDGKEVINNNPENLIGNKLEGNFVFFLGFRQFIKDVKDIFDSLDIRLDDSNFVPAPIASASVFLTREFSIPGCSIVDIGHDSTKLTVFEDDAPIIYKSIPVGSKQITQDLASELNLLLPEAELIKHGNINDQRFSASQIKKIKDNSYKKLLKQLSVEISGLPDLSLAAGTIFYGGGSNFEDVSLLSSKLIKGPVNHIRDLLEENKKKLLPSNYITAYGLTKYGSLTEPLEERDGFLKGFFKKLTSLLP